MCKISKQLFEEKFHYLFEIHSSTDIKLDGYEILELLNSQGDVFKYDIISNKFDDINDELEQYYNGRKIDVILFNFFSDMKESDDIYMRYGLFEKLIQNIMDDETSAMWCSTNQQYNTKNKFVEVFVSYK